MIVDAAIQLTPAEVLEVQGSQVVLALPDGPAPAILALAMFYRPVPGDVVLAIRDGEQCFVIGVIHGNGDTVVQASGNLNLLAPRGSINISASRGFNVYSPSVTLRSVRLEIIARSVFEKFGTAYRWVKECCQVRAGRLRTVTKGSYHLRAGRIVETAKKDVKIDGDRIDLG